VDASLRIAIADRAPEMHAFYREIVPLLGHQVTCVTGAATQLLLACRLQRPDLVIVGQQLPDGTGILVAQKILDEHPVPIILVSEPAEPATVEPAYPSNVLAHLVKPIKCQDLQPAILLAAHRFAELERLRQAVDQLRRNLDERLLIERAKALLMKKCGLDEEAAYARLRKLARDQRRKIAEIAQALLAAEELFSDHA
jgi:response regulator NasT